MSLNFISYNQVTFILKLAMLEMHVIDCDKFNHACLNFLLFFDFVMFIQNVITQYSGEKDHLDDLNSTINCKLAFIVQCQHKSKQQLMDWTKSSPHFIFLSHSPFHHDYIVTFITLFELNAMVKDFWRQKLMSQRLTSYYELVDHRHKHCYRN